MATKNTFGGQLGVAETAIKTRKDRLDAEEAKANGESPKESPNKQPDTSKGDKPTPQSKKWYQ